MLTRLHKWQSNQVPTAMVGMKEWIFSGRSGGCPAALCTGQPLLNRTAACGGAPGNISCIVIVQHIKQISCWGVALSCVLLTLCPGALGSFAAATEYTFGALVQRVMAQGGVRLHYGHPDVFNKLHIMTRVGPTGTSASGLYADG